MFDKYWLKYQVLSSLAIACDRIGLRGIGDKLYDRAMKAYEVGFEKYHGG